MQASLRGTWEIKCFAVGTGRRTYDVGQTPGRGQSELWQATSASGGVQYDNMGRKNRSRTGSRRPGHPRPASAIHLQRAHPRPHAEEERPIVSIAKCQECQRCRPPPAATMHCHTRYGNENHCQGDEGRNTLLGIRGNHHSHPATLKGLPWTVVHTTQPYRPAMAAAALPYCCYLPVAAAVSATDGQTYLFPLRRRRLVAYTVPRVLRAFMLVPHLPTRGCALHTGGHTLHKIARLHQEAYGRPHTTHAINTPHRRATDHKRHTTTPSRAHRPFACFVFTR
ncbi:hypothetical protein E2C01_031521 [Portunus trituberculatus]|uniref:Uncharacterized protein n=1 Tax=Portunus trituberculatus TaxID=210409 RepID=A0A5B7ETP9_PORTR|nr:hypothetical protein [Portunus trituberculatus]